MVYVAVSQILIPLLVLETRLRPSGEKNTKPESWPSIVRRVRLVTISQILMVLSDEAVTRLRPSGENESEEILRLWPMSDPRLRPVVTSQIVIAPLPSVDRSVCLSGENTSKLG